MEKFAFWFYCLVVFPLALQALAGPIVLKKYGFRALLPAVIVIWLTPFAGNYFLPAAPEILVWILPVNGGPLSPPLEALVCYTLPVWLSLFAIWLGAHEKRSLMLQSVLSAGVSAALLIMVSPPLQTWVVQNYPPGS